MKAWRRQIQEWPVVVPQTMDPASAPPWMHDPAEERELKHDVTRALSGGLFHCLAAPVFFLLVALAFQLAAPGSSGAILIGLASVAALLILTPFLGITGIVERVERRHYRRLTDLLEARGETILGGDVVGVSYSGQSPRNLTLGEDMDQGVMRIDFDRLTFVGRHSQFELPSGTIVSTEIYRTSPKLRLSRFRLYLSWQSEGRNETLSLCLPFRRSAQKRAAEVLDLQKRIESWRGERRPFVSVRPSILPPSLKGPLPSAPLPVRTGKTAKILAALSLSAFASVAVLCLALGIKSLGGYPPFAFSSLSLFGAFWLPVAVGIEKRLPERYRFRDPNPTASIENLGELRDEESETLPIRR